MAAPAGRSTQGPRPSPPWTGGRRPAAAAAPPPPPPPTAALPPCPRARALLESFRRADIKAQASFNNHEMTEEQSEYLFGSVADSLKAGTLKVHSAVADGAEQIGSFFK